MGSAMRIRYHLNLGSSSMIKLSLRLLIFVFLMDPAVAQTVSPEIVKDIAPSGRLRAAINFGNPVLAQKDPVTGEPRGVSADLARELAARLGVQTEFVTFDTAGKVFDALKSGAWDICFLAIDPVRAAGIDFTAPYVIIEGTYAVPSNAPFQSAAEVDREGVRIAAGQGSAYDLYLTRSLRHAELVRGPSSQDALDMFLTDKLDAAAGVRQPLVAFAAAHSGIRVLPDRFMLIEQAMGMLKGRDAGARYLRSFVEEMKTSGFVAKALEASGQAEATVAPPYPLP
jgi:polar amino acid transport system substrate-binding protein